MPGERFARRASDAEPRAQVDASPAPEAPTATSAGEPVGESRSREPRPPQRVVRDPAPQRASREPAPQRVTREPAPAVEPEATAQPDPGEDRPSPAGAIASEPAPQFGRQQPHAQRGEVAQPIGREQAQPATQDRGAGPEPLERGASTAPQLRRFIKSRAYVPMHELRRRFGINGNDDDVTTIELERGRIYVGLPDPEGRLLGELLRAGDIGYELSMDPMTPIVVGVYPMRPVPRP